MPHAYGTTRGKGWRVGDFGISVEGRDEKRPLRWCAEVVTPVS